VVSLPGRGVPSRRKASTWGVLLGTGQAGRLQAAMSSFPEGRFYEAEFPELEAAALTPRLERGSCAMESRSRVQEVSAAPW
jgi:hypothetical protein